jgi:predicted GNAT family acetyltransferase
MRTEPTSLGHSQVRDEPEHNRFVMDVPDGEAFATYRRIDDSLVISHTEVPRAMRGRGLGARLARGIFDLARSRGERIVPACSFIANWARLNPDYEDLLAGREDVAGSGSR